MHTLRLLQVILFVCSYACARTLGDPADWKSRPDQVVLVCCVFGIISGSARGVTSRWRDVEYL
eukprot:183866-Pyramimonas_sp.AAC.1